MPQLALGRRRLCFSQHPADSVVPQVAAEGFRRCLGWPQHCCGWHRDVADCALVGLPRDSDVSWEVTGGVGGASDGLDNARLASVLLQLASGRRRLCLSWPSRGF